MERFSFELIDYEWDAGTEVYESQADVTLLWRVEPFRLNIPGRIGNSNVENFGQLMLLPPQIPLKSHGPASSAGTSQVVACRFNPDWLRDSLGLNSSAMREDICISLGNRQIEYSMRRLWSVLTVPGFADALLMEGLAMTMAADLAHQLLIRKPFEPSLGVLSPRQLAQITGYLAEEENWPPTVASLSAKLGLSETHFRRLFKATTGETIHGYVERIRLDKAKALLISTKLPLKVISYKLGFAHPSAFSAAFAKLAGQSPRAYRLASEGLQLLN